MLDFDLELFNDVNILQILFLRCMQSISNFVENKGILFIQ
jgi:hypothetical protein